MSNFILPLISQTTLNADPSLSEAIEQALEALTSFFVPLYQRHNGRPSLHGTGFFVKVGMDAYLVSAAHVMDKAKDKGLFFIHLPAWCAI